MSDNFERRIIVVRVIDGDTLVVDVDQGMHQWTHSVQFRLLRINCPEVHGPSAAAGRVATAYTSGWLVIHAQHGKLFGRTEFEDSFGRWLAEVTCEQGHSLSDDLLSSGNAVPYK